MFAQTLQERVCEFQARLRSEDAAKRLLLQSLQTHDHQLNQEHSSINQELPSVHQEHLSIYQEPHEHPTQQSSQLSQAVSPTGERHKNV